MSKKHFFDDPFFDDDDFDKEFKKMEKEMGKMFTEENVEYKEKRSHKSKPRVAEIDENGNEVVVEEPDDDDEEPKQKTKKTYYYSSSTSYSNSNGVQHATKKTYDSKSGKTEVTEMRKIGDQAVTRKREIDKDGKINDKYDMLNLDENNVGEFTDKWEKSNKKTIGHHDRPQLK
ncbi:cysteine protease [Histomonas meleagridis]|uniref:cysteine protease n=1 Tax=Histomonas meleagridis TaxID=135588 RepID=UPI003559FD98|nr:cysteine protease [Histomonas meleagridis]KAH0807171.1 cysteine protease [Histomonas meleagridis]